MDVSYITNSIHRKQREQLEKYILDFFGTEEAVRENARFYVLEYNTESRLNGVERLVIDTTIRIRPKTKEELENH